MNCAHSVSEPNYQWGLIDYLVTAVWGQIDFHIDLVHVCNFSKKNYHLKTRTVSSHTQMNSQGLSQT